MNEMIYKNILVTGATGLIGSNLVNELLSFKNVRVFALGRSKLRLKECFYKNINNPNLIFIEQDVCEKFSLDEPIDLIFHAAGPMEREIIDKRPVDVIEPNILGTLNCLDFIRNQSCCYNRKIRFVLFSSVTVYGNETNSDKTVLETDTNICNYIEDRNACYFEAKRLSEVIVHSYVKQYNLDCVIARFSTVYGPTFFVPKTAFYEFIFDALEQKTISVGNNITPRRDNIYIDDAIEALLFIAMYGITNEAYNVSSNLGLGNYKSIDEIADAICKAYSELFKTQKKEIVFKEFLDLCRKPGIVLDNNKLINLGWNLRTSFESGLKKTLQFYSENTNNYKKN